MVASFMPSLAFAAAGHSFAVTGTGNPETVAWSVVEPVSTAPATKEYVNVIKKPTHSETGLVELKCQSKFCDEVKEVIIDKIPHNHKLKDFMTPDAYAEAKIAQGEKAPGFAKSFDKKAWCKVKVRVCECGHIGDVITDDANANLYENHTAPSTTLACDASYVCTECQKTIETGNTHTHTGAGTVVKEAAACGNGEVREYTCTVAGCEKKHTAIVTNNAGCTPKNEVKPEAKATATDGQYEYYLNGKKIATVENVGKATASVVGDPAPGYAVDASYTTPKFYVWDVVVTPAATCGADKKVGFTCKDCGEVINSAKYPNVDIADATHDWETKEIAATCESPVQEYKVCKNCGLYYAGGGTADTLAGATKTPKENSSELGHNLSVKKVDATCASAAYYAVKCSACGKEWTVTPGNGKTGNFLDSEKNVSMWLNPTAPGTPTYEKRNGFVELPYIPAQATGAHKYTKKVVLSEATCTSPEYSGYKCDTCGKICAHNASTTYEPKQTKAALGHDFKKVEIAPTCGDYGVTVEQCSRCNLYKDTVKVEGVTTVTTTDDIREADSVTNKDAKPLVAPGAKHSFDKWVVTKDSTVFEEGVKSLECSVCGVAQGSKDSIAKKTVAKASNTVKAGKKSLNVKSSAANATGYRVYYKKAGAKSWKSYTKKTTSLSKTFSGLSKGKYYVKVKAYAKNYAGDGQVVWGATSSTKSVKVK